MNSNTSMASIDKLYDGAKKHIETNAKLSALNAVDKAADALLPLIVILLFVIVVAMFALFVNIGLSFFIVCGFFLILALVLYMFKDNVVKMFINNLIMAKSLKSKDSDFNVPDLLKKKHS